MRLSRTYSGGLTLLAFGLLQGCIFGQVYDSDGSTKLPGVKVDAFGACSGAGCVAADHGATVTETGGNYPGAYVFDAYGDYAGKAKVQVMLPASGADAVRLLFTPNDGKHLSQTVYHHPKYSTITSSISGADKQYSVSGVQPLYLCTSDKVDTDKDGICDAAELKYGTNAAAADTDGDGFSDSEELFGMPCSGVDMRYYGASASHKDIFVYYDWYEAPIPAVLTQVTKAFADANVMNWDKTTGINLHFITGKQIAAADQVPTFYDSVAGQPNWKTPFNVIKDKYFPGKFTNMAHYVLFAREVKAPSGPSTLGRLSGISKGIPSHDTALGVPSSTVSQAQQAGTLMHELGHQLGLMHGGNDNINFKPNYLSVMNYVYQGGLFRDGANGVMDYSRMLVDSVDETSLREDCDGIQPICTAGRWLVSGMRPIAPTSEEELSRYGMKTTVSWNPVNPVLGNCNGPLDWNSNGVIQPSAVAVDTNFNGMYDVFPPSQNDWEHLYYKGHQDGGGTIGCPNYQKALTPQLVPASAAANELIIP